MALAVSTRLGIAGASVVGTAFGMVRYAYGLTLPSIRAEFGVSDVVAGLIASATFVGYLGGLVLAGVVSARRGPRSATTIGILSGSAGCALVASAPTLWLLAIGAVLAGSSAGWVWAPYSDLVTRSTRPDQHPGLLASISTGASGGLIIVGFLALGTAGNVSWRWTWAAVALLALLAGILNLAWTPRLAPNASGARQGAMRLLADRRLWPPVAYTALFFAVSVVYFTYAAEAAASGSHADVAGAVIFIAIGLAGVTGFLGGRLVGDIGPEVVGAGCLVMGAVALAILSGDSRSLPAITISAICMGVCYMVGSTVIPIWTASIRPREPGAAFTAALVIGTVSSIVAPALVGALRTVTGLYAVLASTGVCAVVGAVVLTWPRVRSRRPR